MGGNEVEILDEEREHKSVKKLVENLLFLSQEPLTIKHLADSLPYSREEIAFGDRRASERV